MSRKFGAPVSGTRAALALRMKATAALLLVFTLVCCALISITVQVPKASAGTPAAAPLHAR